MYNHKVKKVKFTHFKSSFVIDKEKALVLFKENLKSTTFNKLSTKVQLKKSFFFSTFSKSFFKKNSIVGSGSFFKANLDLENKTQITIEFLKENPSIILYKSVYWTLNKILSLELEKNNREALVRLLSLNLKKTLSFFLPLNSLLSNLNLESSK